MSAFLILGLQLLPQLIAAGKDVASLISLMREVASSENDPTPEQWAALHAVEDALRKKLHSDTE